jgi:hypothetical protein
VNAAGPTFAQQRLICLALLLGMIAFTIVVAAVLQQNEGKGLGAEPVAFLDDAVVFVGASMALAAFLVRSLLRKQAERAEPPSRAMARFRAVLVPLACLEGGCLFGLVVWMLNGNAVPALATALCLLSLAVLVVPFTDPDAGS